MVNIILLHLVTISLKSEEIVPNWVRHLSLGGMQCLFGTG